MLTISELSYNQEFYNLKDEWNALLVQSGSNNVFLTWEWLYNWWQVYGKEKKLKIVVLRENDELKAIAPLFQNLFLSLKRLQFIGSYGVGSDYLDFILYPGREEELLPEIMAYLDSQRKDWDILHITDISEHSKSIEVLKKQKAFHVIRRKHTTCPYLKLPSTWNELNRSFTQNMRYDLNRKQRKFEKENNGKFAAITEKKQLEEAWNNFILLNKKRMKEKDIMSPFCDKLFNEFHANVFPILFDRGMLRLYSLELEKPIGYIYIIKYVEKYFFYQIGFDPDWNRLSPGMLLFRYSIERAISEGAKEFDFLQGEEEYKFRWTGEVRNNLQLFILAKSFKNVITILFLMLFLKAKDFMRPVKQKIKLIIKNIKRTMKSERSMKPSGYLLR